MLVTKSSYFRGLALIMREKGADVKAMAESSGQAAPATGLLRPDRGYAWVVLAATFTAAVLSNGFLYNVGIYYVIFLQHFGESRASTSWIVASQGICICAAGPVGSELLSRLGARRTLMIGALIHSAAIASMFNADSVFYLIAAFGISGYMIDTSGSFDSALWVTSGQLLLCGFLFLCSYSLHKRKLGKFQFEIEKPRVDDYEPTVLKPFITHQ